MDRFLLSMVLISLSLYSCHKTEDVPLDLHLDYQPLELGLKWVFEVNETIYFGGNDMESDFFFYSDQIIEAFENHSGINTYIVQRTKSADQIDWKAHLTYSMKIENGFLLRKMDNEVQASFQFPPQNNRSWDGNLYNIHQEDLFGVDFIDRYSVGKLVFNDVVKVNQENQDDLITIRDNRYEVFAKNVGLVEKYYEVISYCSSHDCLGEQMIDSGRLTHIKLLSYDKI